MSAACPDSELSPMRTPYPKRVCPSCQAPIYRDPEHDAIYCAKCNHWLEDRCLHISCSFCRDRPLRPVVVIRSY